MLRRSNRVGSSSDAAPDASSILGIRDGKLWPSVHAVLQQPGATDPDVLERLRIEAANYAVIAALLLSAALPSFLEPPSVLLEPGNEKHLQAFGALCGTSLVFQVATTMLSTIIIIHTNHCTTPDNRRLFLAQVDSLTMPNTLCFFIGLLLTPAWLLVTGLCVYHEAVAIGVATAMILTVLAVARTFVRTATRLNGVTTTIAANLVEAKDAAKE